MSGKVNEELEEKKRPGRKPMSPEEKAVAAKARAEEKEKASNLKPELFVQFQGAEIDLNALVEAAKGRLPRRKKTHPCHRAETVCQAGGVRCLLCDQREA